MRSLQLDDTFLLSAIIDKMDIQDDINQLFDSVKGKDAAYAGGQFFLVLSKRLHLARKEVLEFLSAVSEKDIEEVRKLKFTEIRKLFIELFNDEDIRAFFKSATEK
jgi:hypothetical protein